MHGVDPCKLKFIQGKMRARISGKGKILFPVRTVTCMHDHRERKDCMRAKAWDDFEVFCHSIDARLMTTRYLYNKSALNSGFTVLAGLIGGGGGGGGGYPPFTCPFVHSSI